MSFRQKKSPKVATSIITAGKALASTGDVVATTATTRTLGIVIHDCPVGEFPTYAPIGETAIATSGGAIAVGDSLTSAAGGKLVATTTAGQVLVATALESAAGIDENIKVEVHTGTL